MDDYKVLKEKEYHDSILTDYWNQGCDFVTQYGWYILGLVLAFLIVKPYIQDAFDKMQKEREEKAYEAKCKKDPTFLQNRREGIEVARRRMQQEYDKHATLYMDKMKEKAEKKREEQIVQQQQQENKGHRLGNGTEHSSNNNMDSKKKPFKPEYNPLMSNGSGSYYRPPRRGGCPGGGCG